MWTLYGAEGSGSAAVEMALTRCDAAYRIVRAATWEEDSARDELARVNPLGQVPALVAPDGTVLTESAAILLHLATVYPHAALLPERPADRALATGALVFLAANCYAAIGIIDYPERWLDDAAGAPARKALRAGARARLHRYWEIFADRFGDAAALWPQPPGAVAMLAAVVSRWSGARAHLRATRASLLVAIERAEHDERIAPIAARHWPKAT